MNNLTEEEELELALVLSAEEARGEQEARDRQLARQLSDEYDAPLHRELASSEDDALMRAIAQSAEEARLEQEARDRQLASQLSDENEALRYREVASSRADVGLSPQEAAAFAAYARCEKSNNYGKKKRN